MYPAANPVDGIVTVPATSLRDSCRGDGQYGARAYLWLDMRAFVEYLGCGRNRCFLHLVASRAHVVAYPIAQHRVYLCHFYRQGKKHVSTTCFLILVQLIQLPG